MSKGTKIFIGDALEKALIPVDKLVDVYGYDNIHIAGSCRRQADMVGDVDIVIVGDAELMSDIIESTGGKKRRDIDVDGLTVNLMFVPRESFGAAMLYFTGSKWFNIRMRAKAKKMGYRLNQYGLYRCDDKIGGETEEEIFKMLNMEYVKPKERS